MTEQQAEVLAAVRRLLDRLPARDRAVVVAALARLWGARAGELGDGGTAAPAPVSNALHAQRRNPGDL